jgi:hypothetical protein
VGLNEFKATWDYASTMIDEDDDNEPPEDEWDEGEDEWDEGDVTRIPWLSMLLGLAIVSGIAWIGLNAYIQIRQQLASDQFFSSPPEADYFFWAQAVSGILYTVFLVSVGVYVLVWLRGRP